MRSILNRLRLAALKPYFGRTEPPTSEEQRAEFRRFLAENTPLKDGEETRLVAQALGYDPIKALALVKCRAVPFGNPKDRRGYRLRFTYPQRALEWARAQD